ncbi:MAG: tol-pal system-associated acyl-CoA thioesterase [Gammaproteobacteria bacterium]|nr:tol-pal system-associated acyl-CoA thioesterase [Gammaproteobacteria bacterium]MBU1654251.1 tol-pal system-associated acyl-CoA thioesterase [Gammaproteobacteria bacterium]MBU1960399.1 tol-pal system-associated acyl-CoA thioesterase [Gammaproteobacteria bacterium]
MPETNREFILPIRVYYEDTDAGGVVYHTNYLKFMERARTEWLRSLGFEQDRLREEAGVVFAVRGMELEFLKPARFNEMLEATASIKQFGKASLVFNQTVVRGDECLCRALVKVACIDIDRFKPTAIPAELLSELTRN